MRLHNYINITYYVSSYTIFSFISYQNWFMFFSVTPHVAEETYLDLTKANTPVHTAMLARLLRDTNFDHRVPCGQFYQWLFIRISRAPGLPGFVK